VLPEPGHGAPLKISLVVPLRDEEKSVVRLLESVMAQDRRPDEVVIVDAGSQDETAALASSFEPRLPLRVVRAGELYPGLARNAGVAAASHPWIAFTDGGIALRPEWLREIAAAAKEENADVVFGSFDPICDTYFRRCAAVAYVPSRSGQGIRGPFVASMAVTRDAFDRTGGFPGYRAAEDLIFLERLLALPLRTAYAIRAVVDWELAPDARRTFRRFALYSEHNLRAGRGRYWHAGVLRHYVAMGLATTAAVLAAGGAWSLLVYPFWQIARASRSAWQKRRAFDFSTLDPRHVFGGAGILCLIDLATLAGAVRWVRHGRPRTP
jgi:glycosyltransferase involved in cell wall biosynthesis